MGGGRHGRPCLGVPRGLQPQVRSLANNYAWSVLFPPTVPEIISLRLLQRWLTPPLGALARPTRPRAASRQRFWEWKKASPYNALSYFLFSGQIFNKRSNLDAIYNVMDEAGPGAEPREPRGAAGAAGPPRGHVQTETDFGVASK